MNKLELIMNVKEIRHINLLYLINSYGSIKRLAEITETQENVISQIKTKAITNKKTGARKSMGDTIARRIEQALGYDDGWMDQLHFSSNESAIEINDEGLLQVAVKKIINQLIKSGVYEPKQQMDTSVVANLILSEYKELLGKRTGVKNTPDTALNE